jgi:hypothetical protein
MPKKPPSNSFNLVKSYYPQNLSNPQLGHQNLIKTVQLQNRQFTTRYIGGHHNNDNKDVVAAATNHPVLAKEECPCPPEFLCLKDWAHQKAELKLSAEANLTHGSKEALAKQLPSAKIIEAAKGTNIAVWKQSIPMEHSQFKKNTGIDAQFEAYKQAIATLKGDTLATQKAPLPSSIPAVTPKSIPTPSSSSSKLSPDISNDLENF